jgi:L-amino acid N-acyltransferase YncA
VIRAARPEDAEQIAQIFNAGVGERVATFQTIPQTVEDVERWIINGPVLIVDEGEAGALTAFAKVGPYDDAHHYYDSVGEATIYVAYEARRGGIGRELLEAVATEAENCGFHKLIGKIFTSNEASIALFHGLGWSDVGIHRRHGQLDGEWKDVLVVEKLLGDAAEGAA